MEQKKANPNRVKKEKIVARLSDYATRAKGFIFTNYQGLAHKQIEALKKAVKQHNADFVVAKNSLLKLALGKVAKEPKETKETQGKKTSVSSVPSVSSITSLEGPTATLFIHDDIIMPLKELAKTIKEFNLPLIKLAIIEAKILTSEDVLKIASLPPRDILIAQFIGTMKMPIFGLHRALSWNIQKFVMTLKAIEAKKI